MSEQFEYQFISTAQFSKDISSNSNLININLSDSLEWKETEYYQKPKNPSNITLKEFSSMLLNAGILDNKTISLQGSSIWLPYGIKLQRIFESYVANRYEEYGLLPFQYPSLVPKEVFEPLEGLYSLRDKILHVGIESQIKNGAYSALLSPTGEATIYSHWSKYIKQTQLPIKIYRNASYFRPISHQAGMGIFNSMEASGVFEFHAAYEKKEHISKEIISFHRMLEDILSYLYIPRIWTIRPPWTNNKAISNTTYAADTILPFGTSLQISAIYDQGTIFSERYGICVPNNKKKEYTKQIAGFCSRRALLSSMLISTHVHGHFFLPPSYAATQIGVICHASLCEDLLTNLKSHLSKNLGFRTDIVFARNGRDFKKYSDQYATQGIPLTIMIQNKRYKNDKYIIVLRRGDDMREIKVYCEDIINSISRLIGKALSDIAQSCQRKMNGYNSNVWPVSETSCLEDLSCLSDTVRVIPLSFDKKSVREIEDSIKGEILGFINDNTEKRCLVSGKNVRMRAVVCRRF